MNESTRVTHTGTSTDTSTNSSTSTSTVTDKGSKVACGTNHGAKIWLNCECCGIFTAAVVYLLILFGSYACSNAVIIPFYAASSFFRITHLFLFNSFSAMAMYTHYITMTTDPGAVPPDARPLQDDVHMHIDIEEGDRKVSKKSGRKYCRKCSSFKPLRAHHCSMCNRCVVKMDHHCVWANNCVGIGNHKTFLQFIVWICTISCYALGLVSLRFSKCWNSFDDHCTLTAFNFIMMLLLIAESLLFAMFTTCMLFDQASNIAHSQSGIDRLKDIKHELKFDAILFEVFGSANMLTWIIPKPVVFPADVKDSIMGYTNNDTIDSVLPRVISYSADNSNETSLLRKRAQ